MLLPTSYERLKLNVKLLLLLVPSSNINLTTIEKSPVVRTVNLRRYAMLSTLVADPVTVTLLSTLFVNVAPLTISSPLNLRGWKQADPTVTIIVKFAVESFLTGTMSGKRAPAENVTAPTVCGNVCINTGFDTVTELLGLY